MRQAVRKNFEEKVSSIARAVTGMVVTEQNSFLSVDCGLPSDTFNVLVVRDMSAPDQLLAMVDHFNAKGFPLAVWYWENDIKNANLSVFSQHKLSHTETHVAMYADLSEVQVSSLSVEGLEIKRVTTASDLLQFGEVISALFRDSSEGRHVFAYFGRLCEYPPSTFPAMHHYIGTLHGTVVASGTLCIGSETVGIYDVVTRDEYRRRGIGSAMFQRLLEDACTYNRRFCVLQASKDGLGIYVKAGFRAIGDVHTFENRMHLFV
jgi:ribosomal protein S18 acetylase RimI-like enzyme